MANHLPREKKERIIAALVDGASIRSVERQTGSHRDTIMRLGVRVGNACGHATDAMLRNLTCQHIQADEMWGFVGKKARTVKEGDPSEYGDAWIWTALCADTKLAIAHRVGKRDRATANAFMADLAGRISNRIQLSTDGLDLYAEAVEKAFGPAIDYGRVVKRFAADRVEGTRRYSPPKVTGIKKEACVGKPDAAHISTSYVERVNLTTRMCMRRLTRLTNAFSKKLENLKAAVSLHFAYYNFVRIHSTLKVTPAMASGVSSRPWEIGDLIPDD